MPTAIPGRWTVSQAGGGSAICTFTTFLGLRFRTGSGLPMLPVEEGGFIPANKWMTPFEARVTLAVSGEATEIENMMLALERYKQSTDLVDIVTPYYTFVNGNVKDVEYNFSVDETGSSMAVPTISIQEIRMPNDGGGFGGLSSAGCKNSDCVGTRDIGECQASAYDRSAA